ncbi:MAG: patatin-like phospholipase family protein [Minisyncoccota bacterium]
MIRSKRPKIGLALGSGGSKGLAHIGIIKVLEKNNIPIDFIAGSSIGAMVGGFYATGLNIKRIEEIALDTSWRDLISLIDPHLKQGLIGGEKVKTFIDKYINGKQFKDCKIPFIAVATDLKTGDIVVLNKGDLSSAIRASISIPLVFKPIELNNRVLVDGGLSAPVPVEIVRKMGADLVIAVNLDKHYHDGDWKPGWYDVMNDSLSILRHHLATSNVSTADMAIDVNIDTYWYQFTNGQDKISAGEKAMEKTLPQLKELIYQKTNSGLKKYFKFFSE